MYSYAKLKINQCIHLHMVFKNMCLKTYFMYCKNYNLRRCVVSEIEMRNW